MEEEEGTTTEDLRGPKAASLEKAPELMEEMEQQKKRLSWPLWSVQETETKLMPAWEDGKSLQRKRNTEVSTDFAPRRQRKMLGKEGEKEAPPPPPTREGDEKSMTCNT